MKGYALASLLVGLAALSSSAQAQTAMLEPPTNNYFTSQGSWGQSFTASGSIALPSQHGGQRSSAPVAVAIIDTGLDWNHKNIAWESLWRNPQSAADSTGPDKSGYAQDVIGWDFFDRDNKPWDYDGHGTFIAGLIAGSWNDKTGIAGINPLARLMTLKAINNFGHTRASYIAEALTYAVDHGARVINLSVGGKQITKMEQAAIDYAFAKGVVIVVAAGNEAVEISNYGIAASDRVLTVASTGFEDERLVFSNWGKISVAAPGLDILSLRARRTDTMLGMEGVKYTAGAAYVGDDKRYYRASGTSFSAPMVSGLASLMIANDPSLTNRQVMNIIKSTARDVRTPGVDQYTGYGIIDARAALKAPKDYFLFAGINRVEVVPKGGNQAVL